MNNKRAFGQLVPARGTREQKHRGVPRDGRAQEVQARSRAVSECPAPPHPFAIRICVSMPAHSGVAEPRCEYCWCCCGCADALPRALATPTYPIAPPCFCPIVLVHPSLAVLMPQVLWLLAEEIQEIINDRWKYMEEWFWNLLD
ncbi:unnamed protein product, partial [Prorocentrum cordatum]